MKSILVHTKNRLKLNLFLFHILLCFFFIPAYSASVVFAKDITVYEENEVKAALLIKFTDFVKWPPESFFQEPDTFVLGILGDDIFKGVFDSFVPEKIDNRHFKVKNFSSVDEIKQVQILFISESEKESLPEILEHLKGRDILTVGDTKGFAKDGVIINFIEKKGSIGFEINMDAKKLTKLNISSHLLRLAEIVSDN